MESEVFVPIKGEFSEVASSFQHEVPAFVQFRFELLEPGIVSQVARQVISLHI